MKRCLLVIALFVVCALPASAAHLPILAPHDWWPVYSPDSRYVAYTEVNGQGRIFTLKVVDTETKRVRTLAQSQTQPQLAGSCAIAGTAGADTILGTSGGGDRIAAGAGNDTIRARNGHKDVVSCGPGRDTVWADRSDRLSGCEIVHR